MPTPTIKKANFYTFKAVCASAMNSFQGVANQCIKSTVAGTACMTVSYAGAYRTYKYASV